MPSADAIQLYWKEHREQLRQSENQRSTLTNFLLVIVAALTALIVQQKFAPMTLPLSILIIVLGTYGCVATSKLHERARYHLLQARALTSSLSEMGLLGSEASLSEARRIHSTNFPILVRVRLHILWLILHSIIVVYGLSLLGVTIGFAIGSG